MKIVLDQRSCKCWDQACGAHFGWHFLRDKISQVDCTVEVVDDSHPQRTFIIKDWDGTDKMLVVSQENWAEAYDSWRRAWERQHTQG